MPIRRRGFTQFWHSALRASQDGSLCHLMHLLSTLLRRMQRLIAFLSRVAARIGDAIKRGQDQHS